jgi:hypothetical protein
MKSGYVLSHYVTKSYDPAEISNSIKAVNPNITHIPTESNIPQIAFDLLNPAPIASAIMPKIMPTIESISPNTKRPQKTRARAKRPELGSVDSEAFRLISKTANKNPIEEAVIPAYNDQGATFSPLVSSLISV